MQVIGQNIPLPSPHQNSPQDLLHTEQHVLGIDCQNLVETGSSQDTDGPSCTATQQHTFFLDIFQTVYSSFVQHLLVDWGVGAHVKGSDSAVLNQDGGTLRPAVEKRPSL